jgi:Tfp pilus assembly protein PilO
VNGFVTRIRSSRQASAAFVIGGVVLVALVAWVAVVSPKRSDASRSKTEIAAAQSQLAIARQQAATARRTKAIAAAVQRALPASADEPGILDNLQAVGNRTGVLVTGVTPNGAMTLTNAVALTVNVEGRYFQIRDFLHRLRTQVKVRNGGKITAGGRLFDVTGVNISQPTQGTSTLTGVLTVNAYLYGPSTTAATTPDATSAQATAAGAPN